MIYYFCYYINYKILTIFSYQLFRTKGGKSPKWTFTGNSRTTVSELKLPSVSSERRKFMKSKNTFWAILLILAGVFLTLNNFYDFNFFHMSKLWPLFLLVPGLSFEFDYFSTRRNPGVLVPGGILTVLGLHFLFATYTSFVFEGYTWPIYPLAVAIGLFQLYLHSERNRGLLVPVFILGGVSLFSYASIFLHKLPWFSWNLLLPVLLIVFGIYMLFNSSKK